MNATKAVAAELALLNRQLALPPEIWIALIGAAVKLLLECFDDPELASDYLTLGRFEERVVMVRLRLEARRAGVPRGNRKAAARAVLDRSKRTHPMEVAVLWHDRLQTAQETAEHKPLVV